MMAAKIQRITEPRATFTSGDIFRPGIAEVAKVLSYSDRMRLLFGKEPTMNKYNVNSVALNPFVLRQTSESEFTHWVILDGELVSRTLQAVASGIAKPGYRDGVLVVRLLDCAGLFTSLVTLREGDALVGSFKARRDGELPRVKVGIAAGDDYVKPEAAAVDVILYASKTLAEDGDNALSPTDGNWEIVSVNGLPTVEDAPIDPMTLMYNHFHVQGANDGGTSTGMTPEQFENAMRVSFLYWRDKAMVLPR